MLNAIFFYFCQSNAEVAHPDRYREVEHFDEYGKKIMRK